MSTFRSLASSLLDALRPYNWRESGRFFKLALERCVLCKTCETRSVLCDACTRDLPWREHQQVTGVRPFLEVSACFNYAFPLIELIAQAKFAGNVGVLSLLGRLMAARCPFPELDAAVICPVPISYRRHLERGFNQSWVLGRMLGAETGLPVQAQWLKRSVHTAPQRGLGRTRRVTNVRDVFRANTEVSGRRIVLVDDVLTTGATLRTARRALIRAGASEVLVWACAAVP